MNTKQQKQLTLLQLIGWASENKVTNRAFWTSNKEEGFQRCACFDADGKFFTRHELDGSEIFTVEV